jgi:hypothetical protein
MASQSQSQTNAINKLQAQIEVLGEKQNSAASEALKLNYGEQITEKQKTLNIYLTSQQGKFSSPISVVLSHSYRSHIFAHSLFDISSSPIQVRQVRKVRGDGDSWNVELMQDGVFNCLAHLI